MGKDTRTSMGRILSYLKASHTLRFNLPRTSRNKSVQQVDNRVIGIEKYAQEHSEGLQVGDSRALPVPSKQDLEKVA